MILRECLQDSLQTYPCSQVADLQSPTSYFTQAAPWSLDGVSRLHCRRYMATACSKTESRPSCYTTVVLLSSRLYTWSVVGIDKLQCCRCTATAFSKTGSRPSCCTPRKDSKVMSLAGASRMEGSCNSSDMLRHQHQMSLFGKALSGNS